MVSVRARDQAGQSMWVDWVWAGLDRARFQHSLVLVIARMGVEHFRLGHDTPGPHESQVWERARLG